MAFAGADGEVGGLERLERLPSGAGDLGGEGGDVAFDQLGAILEPGAGIDGGAGVGVADGNAHVVARDAGGPRDGVADGAGLGEGETTQVALDDEGGDVR